MSKLFDDPTNVDDFYLANVDQLRDWLKTFTDAELAVVQRVAYRSRYIATPQWAEGQTDTLYATADGQLDLRMFAAVKGKVVKP